MRDRFVDLVVADRERRREAQRGRRHGVDDQAGVEARPRRRAFASMPVGELGGEQEAEPRTAATLATPRQPAVSRAPASAASAGTSIRSHLGQHGARRGGRQRLAAEGRGVVARLERGGDVGLGPARADRARRCRGPWPW